MSSFNVSLDDLETVRAQMGQLQTQDLDPSSSTAPLAAQQFHNQTASSLGQMQVSGQTRHISSMNSGDLASNFGPTDQLAEAASADQAHGQAQAAVWALIGQCAAGNDELFTRLNATHAAYAQIEGDLNIQVATVGNGI